MAKPLKVFISYSHKDESFLKELEAHLASLQRKGAIEKWHDRRIGAGTDWKNEIDKHLNEADIVLLLVSSDFINSDYCHDIEMKAALARHAKGETLVIPIIVRVCVWNDVDFAHLQALPKDAKAVKSWTDPDEAWTDIARGIGAAVARLQVP